MRTAANVRDLFGASLTGMLYVAQADGALHWNERAVMIETARTLGDHVSAEELLEFLDGAATLFATVTPGPSLFEPALGLPGELKQMVLHSCTKLAFSDGHLHPKEAACLRSIADWIGLTCADRQQWRRDVSGALAGGESRGFRYSGIEHLDLVLNDR